VLRYTHVSIPTRDPDSAIRWYQELFGLEEVPAPRFRNRVRWLRVGNMQLHLYESNEERAPMQHFGIAVDEFEAFYRKGQAMGALDEGRGHHLFVTPAGEVQLYLRDPDGNNIEVNWPDASTLPRNIVETAIRREDQMPQSEWNRSARLFMSCAP
jgi:lactoylglutathione lyase